ncbi:choice-of-anchor I family protein [Psychrobium sp. 1_MG-2023]|uniref:choice-of-anchor I family protein n=1 Tax=Psychrobium sp. 1_MG-2023 TaxID=3062624 RepID=UPI000C329494|nr:choice-of-anchor I family protein [Psychrobium sp. 1_MG-2023]MDP2561589.1 choice-of-anchor I family protein [Psychrobium sp. 1_MG-2023]PKF55610.1 alkaline phosphatase [Alteromonadales bacterium alter-6D02]
MKKSIIAISLLTLLAGCSLEGDDGQPGVAGQQGATGLNGSDGRNGENANALLDVSLVARAQLNVESPEGAAEIVAYHKASQQIFALNSSGDKAVVEVLSAKDFDSAALVKDSEGVINNSNLVSQRTIDLSANTTGDANSIAISEANHLLAVAMAADTGVLGKIAFYDISADVPVFIKNVTVGYLPDMVTFSHDGLKAVVANEGEPAGDYSIDPEGSISIIDIVSGTPQDTATDLSLTVFNGQQEALEAQGVIFSSPNGRTINGKLISTTVAMDLEPEYVAISQDSSKAFVTLQENNALVTVNLNDNSMSIKGFGFKEWGDLDFDASDKDGGINFMRYPGLKGMYQPDSVASFQWQGADFIVTANEGDGREYFFDSADETSCLAAGGLDFDSDDGCLAYTDESRVEDLSLAANFDYLNNDDNDIGRLKVSTILGDADNDGTFESLYTFGGRSFTIWDSNGLVVFDSGDMVDRITASIHGEQFNNDEDENEGDTRSDAKGAEPEALAIGQVGDRTIAFVGLERMAGIMAFDITNPYNSKFLDYFINRGTVEGADITGDLAPEGMVFVAASDSPTDEALLIIGNEISGTVAVWQIVER